MDDFVIRPPPLAVFQTTHCYATFRAAFSVELPSSHIFLVNSERRLKADLPAAKINDEVGSLGIADRGCVISKLPDPPDQCVQLRPFDVLAHAHWAISIIGTNPKATDELSFHAAWANHIGNLAA